MTFSKNSTQKMAVANDIKQRNITEWLPTSKKELEKRGWDEVDVILFSGDAYVDHPAFGVAAIGRVIESQGLKVAIVPQPNWRDDLRDFKKLGRPRLFFAVTSGNMDSMVNHYTAQKRRRSNDAYTPDGRPDQRPDYALNVYCNILKDLYPEVPILIGGIEASLRRITHYDYWSDQLQPSVLIQSKADLMVYGLGEKPLLEIIRLAKKGVPLTSMTNIPQTSYVASDKIVPHKNWPEATLNSFEDCKKSKAKFADNFRQIETESNTYSKIRFLQKTNDKTVVINPPYEPLQGKEADYIFDLPYTRVPHPRYTGKKIPAFEMIKFSINSHRGCFGGCSFCTISAHQGKFIASRSEESILNEVDEITKMPDFKGIISDIGGPSANMYKMEGKHLEMCKSCKRPSCIWPDTCINLKDDHKPLVDLYKKVENHQNIKKAFIGSGVRYDMFYNKKTGEVRGEDKLVYAQQLIKNHVSGRLKVAPEHTAPEVLKNMRKTDYNLFFKFEKLFQKINGENGLKQQLIPYFISSHPGSRNEDMADLAAITKEQKYHLEQVQDFTPTPMTLATVMYYTGIDPYTGNKVYTARTQSEKTAQRRFFFWYKREERGLITADLEKANRLDLIKRLFDTGANKQKKQPHVQSDLVEKKNTRPKITTKQSKTKVFKTKNKR